MHAYETLFIIRPDLEAESIDAAVERFKTLIKDENGTVESIEKWGKRRLAYLIGDYQEGYYVLINFTASAGTVQELERIFKISEEVIRYLTTRKDA